jgi:hypothetical protein
MGAPMTEDCDRDDIDRRLPDLGAGVQEQLFDPETSVLVTSPTDKWERTARAETDVHTAILRGLASYVAGLQYAIAGRLIAMSRVTVNWADRDDGPVPSPSANVTTDELGRYSTQSGMAPGSPRPVASGHPNRVVALTSGAIYELDQVEVGVMCQDDVERAGVRRMLEDAFWPVEWMAGFRLVLPRYHGAVCEFLCATAQQADATDLAGAGIRPLAMRLRARCPVYRVHEMPLAHPSVTGTIVAGTRRI